MQIPSGEPMLQCTTRNVGLDLLYAYQGLKDPLRMLSQLSTTSLLLSTKGQATYTLTRTWTTRPNPWT